MAYFGLSEYLLNRPAFANMLGQTLCDACMREIAAAEEALRTSARNPHRQVHRARKALRRSRALLALNRHRDDAVAKIDSDLKRVARTLSRLRDAAVAVATLDQIVKRRTSGVDARNVESLRDQLVHRRNSALASAQKRDPSFSKLRACLRTARESVRSLTSWEKTNPRTIERAVERSLRRVAKVENAARQSNAEYVRHRWRRRLRRCNDQRAVIADLLTTVSLNNSMDAAELAGHLPPSYVGDTYAAERMADITHILGVEHDVRLLRQLVRKTEVIDDEIRDRLLAALKQRLHKLHKRSEK